MSNSKFTALASLASLAVLAAAPMAVQAEMTEMADTEMSDVNGQGVVTGFVAGVLGLPSDPFPVPFFSATGLAVGGAVRDPFVKTPDSVSYPVVEFQDLNNNGVPDPGESIIRGAKVTKTDSNFIPAQIGSAFGAGIGAGVGSLLLPLTGPTALVGGFNTRALANFTATGQSVADTGVRLLTTPIRAVINPINGALDDAAALGKGLVSGARFSAVGAVGGATTRILAGAAKQTNSRLIANLAYASDQARVQQQAKIGTTLGVTVTVPKYTVSPSLLAP